MTPFLAWLIVGLIIIALGTWMFLSVEGRKFRKGAKKDWSKLKDRPTEIKEDLKELKDDIQKRA